MSLYLKQLGYKISFVFKEKRTYWSFIWIVNVIVWGWISSIETDPQRKAKYHFYGTHRPICFWQVLYRIMKCREWMEERQQGNYEIWTFVHQLSDWLVFDYHKSDPIGNALQEQREEFMKSGICDDQLSIYRVGRYPDKANWRK